MTVRAKFKCEEIRHNEANSNVVLRPVVSGSDENKAFYKWTPGGECNLSVLKRETADHFVPGKEYYVDFTPAERTLS